MNFGACSSNYDYVMKLSLKQPKHICSQICHLGKAGVCGSFTFFPLGLSRQDGVGLGRLS